MREPPQAAPLAQTESTRDRIKSVGAELFVVHGHDGFSFGDIAAIVGITRANIHHHFGSKRKLMAEIVGDICENAEDRIRRHWLEGELTFERRLQLQLDDLRQFHQRFNPEPGDRRMWSPLSRLRHDLEALDEEAANSLERVSRTYDHALREALGQAVAAGEFRSDLPVDDVARLLRVSFLAWSPMTQDSGSFGEIEALFSILARTLRAAWGHSRLEPSVDRNG